MPRDIAARLREHDLIGTAPEHEIEWLRAHGELRSFAAGDYLARRGDPVDHFYVLLSGHVEVWVPGPGGVRKVLERRGGEVTGLLPYSRLTHTPGDAVMRQGGELWAVHRDHLRGMTVHCPAITARLVHYMTDRARRFTSRDLQDEKAQALGRLAAGLAHELNNPASAIVRSAKSLAGELTHVEAAFEDLAELVLDADTRSAIAGLREAAQRARAWAPLERADREDELTDWCAAAGLDAELGSLFVDTAVTLEDLQRLRACAEPAVLRATLRRLGSAVVLGGLASEIEGAAARIFDLVKAAKGFTHMDRAIVASPVDVAESLRDTLTILSGKAEARSVTLRLRVGDELPLVRGLAGELNQIWASLIDNAIDAVEEGGVVTVTARHEGDSVVVEVADDGPGIPDDVVGRIFDPFFTTKDVGEGVGLGLDVARRLLLENEGQIDVSTKPGETVFRVTLHARAV